MTTPSRMWLSTHLHFSAATIYGAAADEVIVRAVAPLVSFVRDRCDVNGFFFIRYSEGGPHIRLRFHAPSAEQSVATRDVIESAFRFSAESVESSSLRMVWADYDPETTRYGGPSALPIAERVFHASSIAAIGLLDKDNLSESSRLGRALLAMLATAHVFLPSAASARTFAARYCGGFLPSLAIWRGRESEALVDAFRRGLAPQETDLRQSIEEAWRRLEAHSSISVPIDEHARSLRELRNELRHCYDMGHILVRGKPARTWNECVQWLLPSFVHMTNNRLGVSIEQEAYLAYVVQSSLSVVESASAVALPEDVPLK